VRYVWLAVIALSLGPVAVVGFMLNPLVFWALGPEAWRDRLVRFYPYRWWFVLCLAVFGTATTVYAVRYG
jgi:hypothetical protein